MNKFKKWHDALSGEVKKSDDTIHPMIKTMDILFVAAEEIERLECVINNDRVVADDRTKGHKACMEEFIRKMDNFDTVLADIRTRTTRIESELRCSELNRKVGNKEIDAINLKLDGLLKPPTDKEICLGCGTTATLEEIRSTGGAISCCPEREMVSHHELWNEYAKMEAEMLKWRRMAHTR